MQTLNWNSHHIDAYIMEVMALVRDVNETLATIKGNVKRTSEVLAGWVANPMFDRKEGKVHFPTLDVVNILFYLIVPTHVGKHQQLSTPQTVFFPDHSNTVCCKPL